VRWTTNTALPCVSDFVEMVEISLNATKVVPEESLSTTLAYCYIWH
jgi:hypothetical protein